MLIHKQRQILREVYFKADEALEILNAALSEDQENYVLDIYERYRAEREQGNVGRETLIKALMQQPPAVLESDRAVASSVALILTTLFEIQDALHDLSHITETTIMDVRDARLARNGGASMNSS
jgi:hypothetical protein